MQETRSGGANSGAEASGTRLYEVRYAGLFNVVIGRYRDADSF